jgi:hypothetical protein
MSGAKRRRLQQQCIGKLLLDLARPAPAEPDQQPIHSDRPGHGRGNDERPSSEDKQPDQGPGDHSAQAKSDEV